MANSKSKSGCENSNHVVINPYIYLSCIKIHGNRILPPLMSPEKREEMRFYRNLALQVEENLKLKEAIACRENYLNSSASTYNSDDCATFSEDNRSPNSSPDKGCSSSSEEPTLKSQIFSESCKSDVLKMLHDRKPLNSVLRTPSCENTAISKVPLSESSPQECDFSEKSSMPLKPNQELQEGLKFKPFTLSTIEQKPYNVTDHLVFNQNLLQKFANGEKTNSKDRTSFSPVRHSKASGDSSSEISPQEPEERTPSPRLIRSNSYVLEKPSPYLLAMMQQQESSDVTPESSGRKRRTWDLKSAQQKWSSIENDLNSTSELRSPKRRSENNFNSLPNSTSSSPDPGKSFSNSKKIMSPEKETIQPLPISSSSPKKRKIEINRSPQKTETCRQRRTSFPEVVNKVPTLPKRPEIVGEKSQVEIREIIDKIQKHQSTEMTNLIAKQRREQERLMKVFAEQQAMLLTKLKCVNAYRTNQNNKKGTSVMLDFNTSDNNTINDDDYSTELNLKQSEKLLLECKKLLDETSTISLCDSARTSNQTLYCTAFSSPEENSFKSDQRNTENDITLTSDLLGDSCGKAPRRTLDKSSSSDKYNRSFSIDSLERNASISAKETLALRSSSCNRQLFPTKKQIWAASTINAYIRGYLVRRLLKTDRLKDLVVMMRESIMCAMSYLVENPDTMKFADIELHKGLLQQISGNLKTIHSIFFELSKSEQMKIITVDRNIQKARALRPISARSSASLSSTTQRVLERKLKRRCSDLISVNQSRTSSSKTGNASVEFRNRTKSLGHPDTVLPVNNRKSYPQNDLIRGSMSYGANKKPWR